MTDSPRKEVLMESDTRDDEPIEAYRVERDWLEAWLGHTEDALKHAEAERDLLRITLVQILGITIDTYKPSRDMQEIGVIVRNALTPIPRSEDSRD